MLELYLQKLLKMQLNIELKDERLFFIEIEKSGIEDKKNNAGLVRNYGFEYIKNLLFDSK